MKTLSIILMFLLGLFLYSQTESDAKDIPHHPKILKCNKITIAHNKEGSYPFKLPHDFLVLNNGGFLVVEGSEALEFDKDGMFRKTFIKKGRGPAEATFLYQIYKRGNEIVANADFGNKLMVFDQNGSLKEEYKQQIHPRLVDNNLQLSRTNVLFLAHFKTGDFLALHTTGVHKKISSKIHVEELQFIRISSHNKWEQKLINIHIKCAKVGNKNKKIWLISSFIVSASDDEYIYFHNTERYEIKQYSLKENKIVRIWKKKFNPVPIPKHLRETFTYGKTYVSYDAKKGKQVVIKPPLPDHFIDIQGIFVYGNNVLVATSYVDPDKGILTDVFDKTGKYIDSFYLGLPIPLDEALLFFQKEPCIDNETLLIRELDNEGNYVVAKYKIHELKGIGQKVCPSPSEVL